MKKLKFHLIGLAVILIIGFMACQKENSINTEELPSSKSLTEFEYNVQSKINYSDIKIVSKDFTGTNGSNQILVFKDLETFNETLAELERQTEELDNAFVEFYRDLDEEEINEIEEKIGFSDEEPLSVFENKLGFYSLHLKISIEEEQWLNQEELDFKNDPDNHFIMEDEVRTLLNTDCEIQIGNSIYKLTEDGYYEIIDGDLNTLEIFNNGVLPILDLPDNVIFTGNDSNCNECKASGCNSQQRNSDFKESGDYRIKWVVSHWTYPWTRRVAAKVDNYKKKNNHWKDYRTTCSARVYGEISDSDGTCDKSLTFNTTSGPLASDFAKHVEHKITVSTKTKSGWVKAQFSGAGITHSATLTWY